jgi:predicted transcriptional regulator
MVLTTVALTPEMHRRLVIAALEEKAASVEIIRDALRHYLDRRDKEVGKKGKP